MAGGYIEINDTDSIIRGTMAGVDGTFSGTFDSNNIDVISSVHVRDGAVSSYYHFHFAKDSTDVSFTVLKQPFTSIVDIVIPVLISVGGGEHHIYTEGRKPSSITVYKNGVVFSREDIGHHDRESKLFVPGAISYISALRIVDFNVKSLSTYRIEINNMYDESISPYLNSFYYTKVDLQGLITVGFRKR